MNDAQGADFINNSYTITIAVKTKATRKQVYQYKPFIILVNLIKNGKLVVLTAWPLVLQNLGKLVSKLLQENFSKKKTLNLMSQ